MHCTGKLALCLAAVSSALAEIQPERQPHAPVGGGKKLLSYNDTTPSTASYLRAKSVSVRWLNGGQDGEYITTNANKDLVRVNIATDNTTVFVPADKLPKGMNDYEFSPDLSSVLFSANSTPLYRHSFDSDYYLHDVRSGQATPLVAGQSGDIQDAHIHPDGKTVAFIRANDIYLRGKDGKVDRITTDGGPDMFNGIADWVYEEEILASRSAFWFSPDGNYAAFLSINETGVGTYTVPFYSRSASGFVPEKLAPLYPREQKIRYPKVGSTNPVVALNVLDVQSKKVSNIPLEGFGGESIIGEVAWLSAKGHDKFIYRIFNRAQDMDKHVTVDPKTLKTKVVRERDGTDGWLHNDLNIRFVGNVDAADDESKNFYVDVSDMDGWTHIYLYSVDGGKPKQLTSGDWDVRGIVKVDESRQVVYFTAAKRHSTESHVYSVQFDGLLDTVVDENVPAFWDASFSSEGHYYILSYKGPDVPYQELYEVDKSDPIKTITDNAELYKKLQEYNLPKVNYFELSHPTGVTMNVQQVLPPNFDPSKKYPVLFHPYGGPNSQQVTKRLPSYDWTQYLTSDTELNFIIYVVDNRGTGFKGRAYRNVLHGRFGEIEGDDQIWAAKEILSRHKYIDTDHVGMWGWSHGGYTTAKAVETDSGVLTFAMITAPVSDFRLYDSMFTERYMNTYEKNKAGYDRAEITKMDGFRNIKGGVSLTFGSADDNVHPQNSKLIIDKFVGQKLPPSKFKMFEFTDSNHNINFNNAPAFHYKFLTERVWDELQRTDKKMAHQWSKKTVDA